MAKFPLGILRSGIKIADSLTKGVQSKVKHYAWIGQDGYDKPIYSSPTLRDCVVDRTNRVIKNGAGESINIGATLTFVGDVLPNGTSGRREPIDPRDKIILPDDFTGPIIDSPGSVIDPETNRGLIQSVMLGAR